MNQFQSWRTFTKLVISVLVLALLSCGGGTDCRTPPAPPNVNITVDLSSPLASVKLKQGFLHGISPGSTPAETLSLIHALAPGFWRLSNIFDSAAYTFATANSFPSLHGTRIQWVLTDAFSPIYGNPVVVNPSCDPNSGPTCIRSFDELKAVWAPFIEAYMVTISAQGTLVDDFDVFNEPDLNWQGISAEQFYELFKIAHDIIRTHRPAARIVGPSTSGVSSDGFRGFFDYAVAHELRLDAVSWHEFGRPRNVGVHVSTVRNAMDSAYASRPDLKPSEVQINEYAPPQSHLIPGWSVAWLAEFERAGVDAAARACWNAGDSSECERGLDGLLLFDQVTPQPLYWVYWAYAHMPATRKLVTAPSGLTAIASKDDQSGEVWLLVGRESCGATGLYCVSDANDRLSSIGAIDVPIRVLGLGTATSITVTRMRIPGSSQPIGLATPESLPVETLSVDAGVAQLVLPLFADGESFIVILTPAS